MKETLGFVGLGLMGFAMARRLQEAGYPLVVYNRTPAKARPLIHDGAVGAATPADVSRKSNLVFSMLSTSDILREIALGETGILKGLKEGGIHVDCSTVSPKVTRELEGRYAGMNRVFIHCPVLGSVPQASQGSLNLMVGGNAAAVSKIEDVLGILGNKMWKFPRVEQATHAKLLCNSFIAGMIVTLGQAMVFARHTGVAPETLLEIIGNSALNSPMYQTKGKSLIEGNFTPRFYTEHMLKDIDLFLDAAGAGGVPAPGLEVARALFEEAIRLGFGKEDYSSVVKVLEQKVAPSA